MAIILPGPGTPSSGSLGSITYSRNRYGAYTRNRTTPVNPTSPLQNRARQIMTAAVASWADLSSVERAQWENWAALTPWLNKAGETVNLTGQVAYIRHYSAQAQLTYPDPPAAGFDAPPAENNVGSINVSLGGALTFDIATGVIATSIAAPSGATNTWAATGAILLVEMTPGMNPQNNFPGSRWSQLLETGSVASTFAWATGSVAVTAGTKSPANPHGFPYGLSIGQKVWLRCRGVSLVADRRVTTQQIIGPILVTAPA